MYKPFRSLPRTVSTVRNFYFSSSWSNIPIPNQKPSEPQTLDQLRSSPSITFADHAKRMKYYLRVWSGNGAVVIRKHAEGFTASTEILFSQLGSQLNRATGYEDIELLKRNVVEQETRIHDARTRAANAKAAYEEAVIQRSRSQREVNELLQRKSNWTDSDVGRFTTLVREDHLFEQNEARAKEAVGELDAEVDRVFNELMRSILSRYHEEQIWSDKIRSASTYGSMAALGLNLLVFILATLVVEPWKRKRLAQTFEKRVEELSLETKDLIQGEMIMLKEKLESQERVIEVLAAAPPPDYVPPVAIEPNPLLEKLKMVEPGVSIVLAVATALVVWFR